MKEMTKKQKIIVSIVGVFLILLTILGITYAYFITRIIGNTNDNSVILSTANLLLKYTDGNGLIEPDEKILPGTVIESKTFSVENQGTDTISNYGVYIENVINEFDRTQDVKLTLECKIYDVENQVYLEGNCNGLTNATYPILNSLLVANSIAPKIRHDYSLTINYVNEVEIDQSDDMDKNIKGKVQIYDLSDGVDISGSVTASEDGDYVVLGDNLQVSQIMNETYKLVGIAPGTHTIYVKNDTINEDGEVLTTTKGSITIEVERGEEEKLDNNILYITTTSRNITLNITSIDTQLTLEKVSS